MTTGHSPPPAPAAPAAPARRGRATRRPSHIVLFHKHTAENAKEVADVVSASRRAQPGIAAFGAVAATEPHVQTYSRLAAAAAELTEEEADKLRESSTIEDVFPNEQRGVPETVAHGPPIDLGHVSAAFDAAKPAGSLLSYVRGMIDALELVSARLEQRPARLAGAGDQAASSALLTWCLEMIGIASDYRVATGRGVKVAVLDTGVDLRHPDFEARFGRWTTRSFVPGEEVDDEHGHGTHCCGVVAGPAASRGGPRYGVAPDAELLVGKVLSNSGSGFDDQILDGIQWAADEGARVISMSLESPRGDAQPYSALYERVASRLLDAEKGALIVSAAGNQSQRPQFKRPVSNPAACPSILAVAACSRNQRIADFSCATLDEIGKVDFTAPGVEILSAWPRGRYQVLSGTSMATPHVAGIAALLLERAPDLSPRQLWQSMRAAARDLGDAADFGVGLARAP